MVDEYENRNEGPNDDEQSNNLNNNDNTTRLRELESEYIQLHSELRLRELSAEYALLKSKLEKAQESLSKQKLENRILQQECEMFINDIQTTQCNEKEKLDHIKSLQMEKMTFMKSIDDLVIERDRSKKAADRSLILRDHIKNKLEAVKNMEVCSIIAEIENEGNELRSRLSQIQSVQDLMHTRHSLSSTVSTDFLTRSSSMHTAPVAVAGASSAQDIPVRRGSDSRFMNSESSSQQNATFDNLTGAKSQSSRRRRRLSLSTVQERQLAIQKSLVSQQVQSARFQRRGSYGRGN